MAVELEIAEISLLLCTRTLHVQIMHFLPHGLIFVTTMTREIVRVSNVSHGGFFTGPLWVHKHMRNHRQ